MSTIVPPRFRCCRVAAVFGFKGELLGDMSYRGARFATAVAAYGMTVSVIAGGRGGVFMPAGIRWKVERTCAWMSRYRRLNSSSIASRSTSLRMPGSPSVRLSLAEAPVSSRTALVRRVIGKQILSDRIPLRCC